MGPIWGRQDPGGPHVGPMNFAISETISWTKLHLLSIGSSGTNTSEIWIAKYQTFLSWKCILKCLQNGGHFVQVSIYKMMNGVFPAQTFPIYSSRKKTSWTSSVKWCDWKKPGAGPTNNITIKCHLGTDLITLKFCKYEAVLECAKFCCDQTDIKESTGMIKSFFDWILYWIKITLMGPELS